jgi:hypothetical protein
VLAVNTQNKIEDLIKLGPSWKTDVIIYASCQGSFTVQVRDIWGGLDSPVFKGDILNELLATARQYMTDVTSDFDSFDPERYEEDDHDQRCMLVREPDWPPS